MKKLFLYIFLVLMFCNTAYAVTPIESLIHGVVVFVIALIAVVASSPLEINPLIPFGIVYGISIIWHVVLFINFLKGSKKERKENLEYGIGVHIPFFWLSTILICTLFFLVNK